MTPDPRARRYEMLLLFFGTDYFSGRRRGVVVSALDYGSSCSVSSGLVRVLCSCTGEKLYSHSASLKPGV